MTGSGVIGSGGNFRITIGGSGLLRMSDSCLSLDKKNLNLDFKS
jgi:hypothetical protein